MTDSSQEATSCSKQTLDWCKFYKLLTDMLRLLFMVLAVTWYALTTNVLYAQEVAYHKLSINDGLSSRVVYNSVEDDEGFVWLCTQSDVMYYNGFDIEPLSKVIESTAAFHDCLQVYHKQNQLLIQSFADNQLIHYINLSNNYSITFDLDSIVGLGQKKVISKGDQYFIINKSLSEVSVHRFDFTKRVFVQDYNISVSKEVDLGHVNVDAKGGLYVIFDDFTYIYKANADQPEKIGTVFKSNLIDGRPTYTYVDNNQRWWLKIKNQSTMFLINKNTGDLLPQEAIATEYEKINIIEDQQGNLLLVAGTPLKTKSILFIGEDLHVDNYDHMVDYSSHINSIQAADFRKEYWMSTFEGAFYFSNVNSPVTNLIGREELLSPLKGNIIRGIDADQNGTIYFTMERRSNPKYFYVDRPDSVLNIERTIKYSFLCNYDISIDNENMLWRLGCDDKIEGRIESYDLTNDEYEVTKSTFPFYTFSVDSAYIYISSKTEQVGNQILRFDKFTKEIVPLEVIGNNLLLNSHLSINYVTVVNDDLWIGTNQGVLKYNIITKQFDELSVLKGLRGINVVYILVQNNKLYSGTRSRGLIVTDLQSGASKVYDREAGLSNQTAASVFVDHRDNIWVATFDGLNVIHRETGFIGHFKEEDGVSNNEFNRYAVVNVDSSYLYFGTLNGITRVDLNAYYAQPVKPIKLLKTVARRIDEPDVITHDVRWRKIDDIRFNGIWDEILFCFSNNEFEDPMQYQARILGVNDAWVDLGAKHEHSVDRLGQGRYTLEVRGATKYGQVTEDVMSISFRVAVPFYQNYWSLGGLTGILTTILAFFLYKMRIRQVAAASAKRSNLDRKLAELELNALRSQMNPHFIFNSLGSIQYYIQKSDIVSADRYLTKFGLLMRMYLEASAHKYITLEEEFKLLRLYLDLEQLRSDWQFEFIVHIDDEIIQSDVKIPSMLLQPYVENAIIHGLSTLQSHAGKIQIWAKYDDQDRLIIQIDDNGVGRAAAAKNKMAQGKMHKSMGIHIVSDRIATLNRITNAKISIETIDKFDEQNNAAGTRIIIMLNNVI